MGITFLEMFLKNVCMLLAIPLQGIYLKKIITKNVKEQGTKMFAIVYDDEKLAAT